MRAGRAGAGSSIGSPPALLGRRCTIDRADPAALAAASARVRTVLNLIDCKISGGPHAVDACCSHRHLQAPVACGRDYAVRCGLHVVVITRRRCGCGCRFGEQFDLEQEAEAEQRHCNPMG